MKKAFWHGVDYRPHWKTESALASLDLITVGLHLLALVQVRSKKRP